MPVLKLLFSVVCLSCAGVITARADSITLNPVQDTYVSELFAGPNGTTPDMVIGTQGTMASLSKNRGLIMFDLSTIPAGAVVNSVTLRLTVTRVPFTPANSNFHLHRLVQPWDDLESTWSLRLGPDENWGIPGGQESVDFSALSSGSTFVAGVGEYTFASTPGLVGDVTMWLTNSAANHGWLVKTEDESAGFTSRRFASGEGFFGVPVLEVQFDPPPAPLRITSTGLVAGEFCLRFTAEAGKTYTLERRERVDSGEWTIVTTLPPSENTSEVMLCDPVAPEGNRFYRIGEQ